MKHSFSPIKFFKGLMHELKDVVVRSEWKLADYLVQNVNSLSHAFGVVLALAGLVILSFLSYGRIDKFVGAIIFSMSAMLLFGASAVMHFFTESFHLPKNVSDFLDDLDHSSIFLLIAGSYTPLILLAMEGQRQISMMSLIWGVAFLGICSIHFRRFIPNFFANRFFRVSIYMAMGWLVVFMFDDIKRALPLSAIYSIVAEGLAYSIGALVYAFRWPNFKNPYFGYHQIWHIFVLSGFLFHLLSLIFLYSVLKS